MPSEKNDERSGERIAKLLARTGIASRREVERMIAEGRIARDGVAIDTPATVLRSLHGVTVDGQPVGPPEAARLFLFHKPAGLLTTERDPGGRPTIYDRLPKDLPRVMPVGRLDLATEGLLLLTTDGGLKRQLELPATGVERAYRARAYGPVTQTQLEELIEGVEIEGVRYGPIDANLERRTGANVWIEMILTEGKNREVRRVLEHLGLQVGRLIRTRYGPFVLGDLQPGEVGEVKQHDLVGFAKALGSARRGKGQDRDEVIAVDARTMQREPAPPPAPPPEQPRPARPVAARPAKPAAGWGSRTRSSRPAESAERTEGGARSRIAQGPPDRAPAARDDRPRSAPGGAKTARGPAKGPAGGRGHPPRPPKGKPRGGSPAGPRGRR